MTGADVLKFCPRCGSAHFAPKAANHLICAACSFQWFLYPVAGAVCFIFDAQDRVLLIRREKDPGKGRLAPPGGFIDLGETVEDGLRREVREETGLVIGDLTFLSMQQAWREVLHGPAKFIPA